MSSYYREPKEPRNQPTFFRNLMLTLIAGAIAWVGTRVDDSHTATVKLQVQMDAVQAELANISKELVTAQSLQASILADETNISNNSRRLDVLENRRSLR